MNKFATCVLAKYARKEKQVFSQMNDPWKMEEAYDKIADEVDTLYHRGFLWKEEYREIMFNLEGLKIAYQTLADLDWVDSFEG